MGRGMRCAKRRLRFWTEEEQVCQVRVCQVRVCQVRVRQVRVCQVRRL